ncbi:MAG TPA: Spy/CpxP family protein refolding chaperone [Xanthobacteraceae bacterium]|nr:Spy/CpxP family protein refolding chaperone [Xanthobacteraceae bacterium]
MRKQVMAAAAVLVLAGTSLAVAQEFRGPGRGDGRDGFAGRRFSAEDIAAFADARIAGMKAGLRLTPEQEKNWPAFEQAYRALAKQRAERFAARRDGQPDRSGDIVERMQRRAEIMTQRASGFKQLADAAAPLYQSLDDAQKNRFTVLARMLRPRPMMSGDRGRGHRWHHGPRRFHERGGMDRPRFGEEGGLERGLFRTGRLDEHFGAADRAVEVADLDLTAVPAETR